MHRCNLDLKAKNLGGLDANDINNLNFDVSKFLLEVGVAYNSAKRLNNQQSSRDKRIDADLAALRDRNVNASSADV